MGILSDPSNITSTEAILSTSVGQTSTERWEAKAAATAGSTTSIEIGLISGSNRFAHANSVGFNVRKGDRLFKQGGDYIGEVSAVVSDLTGGTTNTVITLTANNTSALSIGDDIYVSAATVVQEDFDAILNRSWLCPVCTRWPTQRRHRVDEHVHQQPTRSGRVVCKESWCV